jgi:hypothetical protein
MRQDDTRKGIAFILGTCALSGSRVGIAPTWVVSQVWISISARQRCCVGDGTADKGSAPPNRAIV